MVLIATKGSHNQFKHDVKKGRVTISHPKKDLPQQTVKSILKQLLGWYNPAAFFRYLTYTTYMTQ